MTLKILHKRSTAVTGGVADAPAPADLEYGEIGINYADDDPALFIKDTADVIRRINLPTQGNSKYSIANDSTDLVGADATTAINAALIAAGDIANATDLLVSDQCEITDSGNPDFNAQAPVGRYWWDGTEWFQGGGGGASVDIGNTAPDPADQGDLWFDTDCGLLKIYDNTDTWVDVVPVMPTGGLTGDACRERVFYENEQVINHDYTLSAGNNAMSAGPITIDTGATITIPTDATWSVVGGSDGSSGPAPSGGVTKLIAGTNITLNPASGLGDVTVSSTGGGGGGDFYAGAAAWGKVNLDGTLAQGLNCTTSRTGAGDYRVNFASPMPSADYSVTASTWGSVNNQNIWTVYNESASGFNVRTNSVAGVASDIGLSFVVQALNALPPKGGTGADAWLTCSGSGGLGASFNIANVTKAVAPQGQYTVTFTTPMPTADYSVQVSHTSGYGYINVFNKATTGFQVQCRNNSGVETDISFQAVVNATNAQLPDTVTKEQIEAAINNPGVSAWGRMRSDGSMEASLNATSSRNNIGNYTVTFTNPMPSAGYSVTTGESQNVVITSKSANSFVINVRDPAGGSSVDGDVSFAVFATNALPPKGGTGADCWVLSTGAGTVWEGFNVDRVERLSQGTFRVFFTNPMPTDKYSVQCTIVEEQYSVVAYNTERTINSFVVKLINQDGTFFDFDFSAVVNATNAQLPDTVTQEQLDAVLDTWERDGTTLKPVNAGDGINVDGLGRFVNPVVSTQTATFHAGNVQGQRIGLSITGYPLQTGNPLRSTAFQVINAAADASSSIAPSWYEFSNAANQGYFGLENTQVVIGTDMGNTPKYYMFTNAGTFIASGTSYPSDRSLKTGIQTVDSSSAIDVVKQLNPTTYQLKADSEGKTKYGFIAQEVEELIPEVVGEVTTPDGTNTKTLDYVSLIPVLTSSLQSALSRIEALEAEVQTLKEAN